MKMFASRFAAYSITALATCGLLMQLAQAQIPDQKCIPQLSPATCSSGGNSVCNHVGDFEDCAGDYNCHYCDDPKTSVASTICTEWEGETCQRDPNQQPKKCDSMANWMTGTCDLSGTCLCLNPAQDGTYGANINAIPCITP